MSQNVPWLKPDPDRIPAVLSQGSLSCTGCEPPFTIAFTTSDQQAEAADILIAHVRQYHHTDKDDTA